MIIESSILEKFGAKAVTLHKNEILFAEGSPALSYFQVSIGIIKMNNYSQDGQEFVQGMFMDGESFGEPPLFADFPYPANAVAVVDSVVWKLSKDNFIRLLKDNFDLHLKFCSSLSNRLQFKSMIAKEMSSHAPDHRLLTLIDYFKEKAKPTDEVHFEVPFTRQQMADMTGLRVETVIRSIKALAEKKELKIINRKVFRKF